MSTVLAAATAFPIPPDGNTNAVLSRAWLTNVMPTASGKEVRSAWRAVPQRRLAYTAVFGNASEMGQFRALWIAASERLRFIVPLWPRAATPIAFPDASTISGDFSNRGFVTGAGTAMLWLSETAYELVDVATVADSTITLSTPRAGTYAVSANGPTLLVPTMRAWLEPPTAEQLSHDVERVPLVFTEELPGIAGIDPSVGVAITPVAATIEAYPITKSSPWGLRKSACWRVTVFDAAGAVIPNAPLTWVITPGGAHVDPPSDRVTFPAGGTDVRFEYSGNSGTGYVIDVSSGSATLTFSES